MTQPLMKHNDSEATCHPAGEENGTTTVSKDPRQATSQPSTPSCPPDIAQQLRDFAAQISAMTVAEAERDSIAKRLQLEKESKLKAEQREFQFPSVLSRNRSAMAIRTDEKTQVDEKLEKHVDRQERLIQSLATNIGNTNESDTQARIKDDIESIRTHARLAELASQQLKEDSEKRMTWMEKDSNEVHRELDSYKSLLDSVSRSIDDLETAETPCKQEGTIHSLEESLKAYQETASRQIEDLNCTVSTLKTSNAKLVVPSSDREDSGAILSGEQNHTLQANFQNLSNQFEAHRRTQETRDNAISEELESAQSTVQRLETKLEELSQTLSKAQKETGDILQRLPSNVAQDAASSQPQGNNTSSDLAVIRNDLTKHEQTVNSLNVAVHSLQTRYNNMTSEPIVRQMVAAMQSMYPYASSAQKDIERFDELLKSFETRMSALVNRLETVEKIQSRAKDERDTFLKDMSAEKDKLLQYIEAQDTKIKSVEETFDSLEKKQQDCANSQELVSSEEKLANKMEVLRKDVKEVENYTSSQLADVLWKIEQIDQQTTKAKADPPSVSRKAIEETGANKTRRREGQVQEERAMANDSPSESLEEGSEQPQTKTALRDLHTGTKTSSPRTASSTNGTAKLGRHLTTTPSTRPHKKRKKSGSLNRGVSR